MKLIQVLPHCDPRSFFHRIGRPDLRDIQSHDYPDWWPAAIAVLTPRFGIRSEREIERIEIPNKSDILRSHPVFRLTPVGQKTLNPLENLQNFPFSHHEWAPLVAAARFCGNPTPEVLKKELEWLADNWQAKHMPPWFWLRFIPWPMAACLSIVQADDDFKQLARRAGAGQLGTREVWEAAEMRWLNQGISNDDFHAMIANDGWPFTERIAERGFPFIASTPALEEGNPPSRIEETFHQVRQIPPSRMRGWLASLMLQQLMEYYYREIPVTINLADYQELLRSALEAGLTDFDLNMLSQLSMPRPLSQKAIHFFDWLGRQQPLIFEPSDLFWPHTEQLVHSFSAAPEAQRGLLPLLAALAVSGNRCEVPQEVLRLCREWDDRSQDDAILLSLARGNCTSEEVNELAERIALNKSNYHILWRAFRILRRFPMERAASFGLAILKQFPTPGQDQNQLAVSILTEYLNNRPSCLGDADVRRRLNLPEPV